VLDRHSKTSESRAALGKSRIKLSGLVIGFGLIALGFVLSIVGTPFVMVNEALYSVLLVIGTLSILAGIVTVIVSAIVRFINWVASRRKRSAQVSPRPSDSSE
jgi:hypothetical protein